MALYELANEAGERVVVARDQWQRLITEAEKAGHLADAERPLRGEPGEVYAEPVVAALAGFIGQLIRPGAPTNADYRQHLERWLPFVAGARELHLDGHGFFAPWHKMKADLSVTVANRKGKVEMPLHQWKDLLHNANRAGWQPRGTTTQEADPWPVFWGGWFDLPSPTGAPTVINSTDAQHLAGALARIAAGKTQVQPGPYLGVLSQLQEMLSRDGATLTFN